MFSQSVSSPPRSPHLDCQFSLGSILSYVTWTRVWISDVGAYLSIGPVEPEIEGSTDSAKNDYI